MFEDNMIISKDSQVSLKSSEEFRRHLKSSEDFRSINASTLPVLSTSKIRGCEEGIIIYEFYTWFLFLTWVWVNIFLEIVSSKTATTHIFQSGVRNWPVSVSWCEIEVFTPTGVRLTPKAWELASIGEGVEMSKLEIEKLTRLKKQVFVGEFLNCFCPWL